MKERLSGKCAFDVEFDKNFHLGAIFDKNVHFGLDLHISDAKTDPFIPFGADLFVSLSHIGIQIT